MDFALSAPTDALRRAIRQFMDARVVPNEGRILAEAADGRSVTLRMLRDDARDAGLFAPHLPPVYGGKGTDAVATCVVMREMGRSAIGPTVFHCDSPDLESMFLLLRAGSPEQQNRYLEPLSAAEAASALCVTEPPPGAGSDPRNLRTRAARTASGWLIEGHKWFATGAGEARFLLVAARTSDDAKQGATLFIIDRDAVGIEHVRDIPVMSPGLLHHRQAELRFHSVEVGDAQRLGAIGEGFALLEASAVPSRLAHAMRWLGLADRALHLCGEYLMSRLSADLPLASHQSVKARVADAAVGIHSGNLMVLHAAWLLDQGREEEARSYSSVVKRHVAELVCSVLDDAIQLHGARGYSDDLPFAAWYRAARSARIVGGPDDVHMVRVARDFLNGRLELLV